MIKMRLQKLFANGGAILGIVLMALPIIVLIPLSFNGSRFIQFPPESYSLYWVESLLQSSTGWPRAALTSLFVAGIAALTATFFGVLAAAGLSKLAGQSAAVIQFAFLSPLFTPPVVVAVSLYRVFLTVKLTDTLIGLSLAHAVLAIPLVVLVVGPIIGRLEKNLEQAARNLGYGPWKSLVKVTLPIIRPAILVAFVISFTHSMTDVVVTLFLTDFRVLTLSRKMWNGFRLEISPDLAAASIASLALSVLILITLYYLSRLYIRKT